jgi:hypothetical protein
MSLAVGYFLWKDPDEKDHDDGIYRCSFEKGSPSTTRISSLSSSSDGVTSIEIDSFSSKQTSPTST